MFARTERLTLRPGWPEEAPALAAAIDHRAVAERLEQVPFPYSEADAAWWLGRPLAPTDAELLILSHEGPRPALVGSISLLPHGDALALGYWLTPAAWGRGYATEAGRAVIAIARHALGHRRLIARPHADNAASIAVLRKLGFTATDWRAPVYSRARGCEVDSVELALDLVDRPAMPLAA